MIDTSVPVVVIFRGGYADVAIARTLGRLGVPLYLIAETGRFTPGSYSRYWTKRIYWDFSASEQASAAFLLEAGADIRARHGAQAILLTLSDWVAVFIERHSTLLETQFLFPRPERPVIHTLANK